jgi:tRNA uridine 5-carboxymethylaminomethyl modification enzyme
MFHYPKSYDVVVAGAGHAGCEAALAAARMGCRTLLLTMNLDTIGQMSCNPAIGGLAKGHMVREIDALGGEMGLNTDATGIQFRMLNMKKGPSVRAPRAQADKKAYQFRMKATIEAQSNLDLKQGNIGDIETQDDQVVAVLTSMGVRYETKSVIITTGTFLKALMHVGLKNATGGRMGDGVSDFSDCLRRLGFEVQRLKTGTPPRLNGKTIDFTKLDRQDGDTPPPMFSFMPEWVSKGKHDIFTLNHWEKAEGRTGGMFHVEQIPCWITYTNLQTAEIVKSNLHQSPLYCGIIEGIGPRYCPSLEDKIVRFADKDRHQVFLEPEGRHTDEYYINGCSTSLPMEVQYAFIRSIVGLEKVEIMRAGYAVEYDFCPPTQLQPTLETKKVAGLYFAGQINGTSGYEEAAGQGLMAGINAALKVQSKPALILGRHEAYLGVLIDDLVSKGTKEPYRMFTSRAEYRLLLRQDNADLRLTEKGAEIGLASPERYQKVCEKKKQIAALKEQLQQIRIDNRSLYDWLKKPEFEWAQLPAEWAQISENIAEQVQTDIKYSGYVERELFQIERAKGQEEKAIPDWVNYDLVQGLKTEARIKLKEVQPKSFGQASRVSGVNPTDLAILAVWVRKGLSEQEMGKPDEPPFP